MDPAVLLFLLAYGYGLLPTVCTLVLHDVAHRRYGRLRDRLLVIAWALLETSATAGPPSCGEESADSGRTCAVGPTGGR